MVASSQKYPFCGLKNSICYGLQGFANGFCKGRVPVPGWGDGGGSQLRKSPP